MSFHVMNGTPRRSDTATPAFAILLCAAMLAGALAGTCAAARADSLTSEWARGKKSSARLIAIDTPAARGYRAGIQIRLDDDAITYWRNPGDAGSPPEFDFGASENVASAEVSLPAPARMEEEGVEIFGYRREVIFPVEVRAKDQSRPARLALTLNYAVCGQICLPVKANLALALPGPHAASRTTASVSAEELRLAEAERSAPKRLTAAERDMKFAIVRESGAEKPTWRVRALDVSGEDDAEAMDLFVESRPGWYFESRRGGRPGEFLIVAAESPREPTTARLAQVTLTLSAPRGAYEFPADLDASQTVATGPEGESQ